MFTAVTVNNFTTVLVCMV